MVVKLTPTPVLELPDKRMLPFCVLLSVIAAAILRPVPVLDVPEKLNVPLPVLL